MLILRQRGQPVLFQQTFATTCKSTSLSPAVVPRRVVRRRVVRLLAGGQPRERNSQRYDDNIDKNIAIFEAFILFFSFGWGQFPLQNTLCLVYG
jgi:hypothetical protein